MMNKQGLFSHEVGFYDYSKAEPRISYKDAYENKLIKFPVHKAVRPK